MPFQKGNKLGKGPPQLPAEIKEARRFNKQELDLALSKLLIMTASQLQNVKNDPEATAVELALTAVLIHAINEGDERKLEFLFNRYLGKVKENIEVNAMHISAEDPGYSIRLLEFLKNSRTAKEAIDVTPQNQNNTTNDQS